MQRRVTASCMVVVTLLTMWSTMAGWVPDNDTPVKTTDEPVLVKTDPKPVPESSPPDTINAPRKHKAQTVPAIPQLSCNPSASVKNMGIPNYCSRLNASIWDELVGDPELKRLMATPELKKLLLKQHELHYQISIGNEPENQRYLIWSLSGGIGNRMQAMVSSFLAALLSNRVFLLKDWFQPTPKKGVKTKKQYSKKNGLLLEDFQSYEHAAISNDQLLCSPFSITHLSEFKRKYPKYFTEEFKDEHVKVDIISKHDTQRKHWSNLTCEDPTTFGSTSKFSYIWANQYYTPVFFMNKKTAPEMNKLFPKQDVFGPLSRFLIRPNSEVEGVVESFLCKNKILPNQVSGDGKSILTTQDSDEGEQKKVIGLQIRAFRKNKMPEMAAEFDHCLKEKIAAILKDPSTVLFMASLHEPVRSYFTSKYPGRVVSLEDKARGEQSTGSLPMDVEAMADLLILGRTSDYFVSPGSTFGSFTSGYYSRLPVQVHTMEHRACSRMKSFQPCFMSMLKGDHILAHLQSGDIHCREGFIDVSQGHDEIVRNCAPHYSIPFKK
eukprot:TRINITY_DN2896_c0_g2_i1.p1 TRINITY_DN2896_c0_g2~~TRINITY_DN2896_c0_g2_i1.p1  ORF type:complete len:550 (+),score=68.21 TRINITY_DN2896_c0_g2_i1:105-1754(+)